MKANPECILPLIWAFPFDDQSFLPSFGFVGGLSDHPEGIPPLVKTPIGFGVVGWFVEYWKIKFTSPIPLSPSPGELQERVPDTPLPALLSVARAVLWYIIFPISVEGFVWLQPLAILAITPELKLYVPEVGVDGCAPPYPLNW